MTDSKIQSLSQWVLRQPFTPTLAAAIAKDCNWLYSDHVDTPNSVIAELAVGKDSKGLTFVRVWRSSQQLFIDLPLSVRSSVTFNCVHSFPTVEEVCNRLAPYSITWRDTLLDLVAAHLSDKKTTLKAEPELEAKTESSENQAAAADPVAPYRQGRYLRWGACPH